MIGEPLTVTKLNEYVKQVLTGDPLLRNVEVTGELSGFKGSVSGHYYFELKDASSVVSCVMYRQNAFSLDFVPRDGMQVSIQGGVSLYTQRGRYQLYVNTMRKSGVGDLYLRFEQLKNKLAREGLFDPAGKRPIPFLPRRIGLVTSATGAAVRDMIKVARARNPRVDIVISPCTVQGETAAAEIAQAIKRLNQQRTCDVLLVGRGGGSMEDLWAFNEEAVVRAIAASEIPVISCVGHEIDTTLSDFAADARASTPSNAAELAVPVVTVLQNDLDALKERLSAALMIGQRSRRAALEKLYSSMVMKDPKRSILEDRVRMLTVKEERLERAFGKVRDQAQNRLKLASGMLRTLDPDGVLERGYAVIAQGNTIVSEIAEIDTMREFKVRMKDGTLSVHAAQNAGGNRDGEEKAEL